MGDFGIFCQYSISLNSMGAHYYFVITLGVSREPPNQGGILYRGVGAGWTVAHPHFGTLRLCSIFFTGKLRTFFESSDF